MKQSRFTEQEIELAKYYSAKQSVTSLFGFYCCCLFVPFAFAVYGLLNRDVIAVFIAFCGLLAFIVWYVVASMKNEAVINSLCTKIVEQEISSADG